jgi:dTDP-glucose 4,6-dehydratase
VAGGAGFLGSAFVRDRLRADSEMAITVVDAMRRPGAEADLADLREDQRFTLVRGDIRDRAVVEAAAGTADATITFASEEFCGTDADGPALARTDLEGTAVLLEAAKKCRHQRFLLASSDEVYGPIKSGSNREEDRVAPRTLPAAARAAAELLASVYQGNDGLPVLITRSVAAFGARQPLDQPVARLITSALEGLPVLIEGDGSGAREYLHVDDQVAAIARVLWKGEPGVAYNIGSGTQVSGSQLADMILRICGKPSSLKHLMKERPRWSYAIDTRRMRPLGWEPHMTLKEGLRATVDWYRSNESWWRKPAAA